MSTPQEDAPTDGMELLALATDQGQEEDKSKGSKAPLNDEAPSGGEEMDIEPGQI